MASVTGNFNHVDLGLGDLYFDNRCVGFLKGEVKYEYNYEIEDFKAGVPLFLYGTIVKEVGAKITASMAEITAQNIAMVMGGLTVQSVTDGTTTITNQGNTFLQRNGSSLYSILLDGPIHDTPEPVIYDTAATPNLIASSEYFVDHAAGVIWADPAGSIDEETDVKVTYTIETVTGNQINMGTQFSLAQKKVVFIHTSPVTGKDKTVTMWLARCNGKLTMPFQEGSFILSEVVLEAIRDDQNHPTNPLGTYFEEV